MVLQPVNGRAMAQRRNSKRDFTTLVKSKFEVLSNRRCKESLLRLSAFDDCACFGDEQAAGFGAEKGDHSVLQRGGMVRGFRWNGPLDLAQATRLAEFFNEALRFPVSDQACDTIHSGLAVHCIAKWSGDGFAQKKRAPVS